MKGLIIAGGALVLGAAAAVYLGWDNGPSGAETSQLAAESALHALSAQDQTALLKLAVPDRRGREAAAQQLIAGCRGSNFEGAEVAVRGGFGDRIAWGDITVPRGRDACRKLTVDLTRTGDGWFVSLGAAEPGPIPTSATNR
ncbi:hypothetical protein ACI2LF_02875 [Kribbella sp. NPDC020789]